ncbi:MAG TPA: M23 family metallopeptidase, partial [Verrucomicrobiae bacterium]|nr:M23 family metallopeptidase [Verrucomicrobiae bacterium]
EPNLLKIGQILTLPAAQARATRGGVNPVPEKSAGSFQWPLSGTISSPYGWRKGEFHDGLDIAAEKGTEIAAARGGTVVFAGWSYGYGQAVKIDHGDGYSTLYAHTSKMLVGVGDQVTAGQVIALVGSTGRSTGPHLHFEVRYAGKTLNPLNYLGETALAADI